MHHATETGSTQCVPVAVRVCYNENTLKEFAQLFHEALTTVRDNYYF